jgi:hypothetical protein
MTDHHSPWGGNMAKRFETTPRGLERTEMSGLLAACAEHPRKQVRKWKRAGQLRLIEERNPDLISGFPPARE